MSHHCFEILMEGKLPGALPEVILAVGDDGFLRKETVHAILQQSGLDAEDAKAFDGEECKWIDVHDELATFSLFESGARRVALVNAGDKFLKDARSQLEKWCETPADGSLLIIQVTSLPANQKIYKSVDKRGWVIHCGLPTGGGRNKAPSMPELKKWIQAWASSRHSLKLKTTQATMVLDAVGTDCGLLHQELAKLVLYADASGAITDELVRSNVGSWRTRTMWEIADAVAEGRVADALEQLERVFAAGEHPAAVIPQIAWSLRRYGNAAQLILQSRRTGGTLTAAAAVGQCGFWGKDVQLAEQRLRRMGLSRASKILEWLLELDLRIKGSHSSPTRAIFALEAMCLRFV